MFKSELKVGPSRRSRKEKAGQCVRNCVRTSGLQEIRVEVGGAVDPWRGRDLSWKLAWEESWVCKPQGKCS